MQLKRTHWRQLLESSIGGTCWRHPLESLIGNRKKSSNRAMPSININSPLMINRLMPAIHKKKSFAWPTNIEKCKQNVTETQFCRNHWRHPLEATTCRGTNLWRSPLESSIGGTCWRHQLRHPLMIITCRLLLWNKNYWPLIAGPGPGPGSALAGPGAGPAPCGHESWAMSLEPWVVNQ